MRSFLFARCPIVLWFIQSPAKELGHSPSFSQRPPFPGKKMPFKIQNPITSIRENVFSHLCAFPLICSFNQRCSISHPHCIYRGFLPLLSLSPLWFLPFPFSPLWHFFLLICRDDTYIFCILLSPGLQRPTATYSDPAGSFNWLYMSRTFQQSLVSVGIL